MYKANNFGRVLAIVILGMTLMFTSCTVLTGLDDAEETKAEAMIASAEAEAAVEIETLRIAAIERLIEKGYGPVGAQCALKGWSGSDRAECGKAEMLFHLKKD